MTAGCRSIWRSSLIHNPSLIGDPSSVHVILNCATVWACRLQTNPWELKPEKRIERNLRHQRVNIKNIWTVCMVLVVNRSWEVITGQVSWCFVPEVLPGVSWAFTDGWDQVWRRSAFGMYTRQSWHICSAAKHRSTLAGQNVDCMEGRPHTCTATHTHTRTYTSGEEKHEGVQREQWPLLLALFILVQIQITVAFRTEKLWIKMQWCDLDPWPTKCIGTYFGLLRIARKASVKNTTMSKKDENYLIQGCFFLNEIWLLENNF